MARRVPEPRASLTGIEHGLYAVPHRGGDRRLGGRAGDAVRGPTREAVAEQQVDRVAVGAEALVDAHLVGDEKVAALAPQLGPREVEHRAGRVAGLRGEPDDEGTLRGATGLDQPGEDV